MSSTKVASTKNTGNTENPRKVQSRRRDTEALHDGTSTIDFVGRRKLWYGITLALVVISLLAMLLRGFNMGIDFEGGTKMTMPAGPAIRGNRLSLALRKGLTQAAESVTKNPS